MPLHLMSTSSAPTLILATGVVKEFDVDASNTRLMPPYIVHIHSSLTFSFMYLTNIRHIDHMLFSFVTSIVSFKESSNIIEALT